MKIPIVPLKNSNIVREINLVPRLGALMFPRFFHRGSHLFFPCRRSRFRDLI